MQPLVAEVKLRRGGSVAFVVMLILSFCEVTVPNEFTCCPEDGYSISSLSLCPCFLECEINIRRISSKFSKLIHLIL